jgi:hypothetical protein
LDVAHLAVTANQSNDTPDGQDYRTDFEQTIPLQGAISITAGNSPLSGFAKKKRPPVS